MYIGYYEGGYSTTVKDVWGKLYAYLLFRKECGGKWINSDPSNWYEYIVDNIYKIHIKESIDDGGGLSLFKIEVINGLGDIVFEMKLYRWVYYDDSEFYKTMNDAYEYMNDYSDLKKDKRTPFNLAKDCGKCAKVDNVRWCKEFEIDKDIEKLPITEIEDLLTFASEGFRFLSKTRDYKKHIKITDNKLEKEVYAARQWAMLTLMEMQRYYRNEC